MIVICPTCSKQHRLTPGRIPPHINKVRCGACSTTFPLTAATAIDQECPSPPRRISVSLSKGGVGKTTTAVNLAAGLACNGHRTLLIDTDTQGQDSFHLGVQTRHGLADLITEDIAAEEALFKARPNLWLLSGGKKLAGMKRFIDKQNFAGEYTLKNRLTALENQFEFIIIDTAPGWDSLTINVLFYTEEIVVPVSLEVLAMHGLLEFNKSLDAVRAYRQEITIKYIVPTFLDLRMHNSESVLDRLTDLYGEKVLAPIRYNVQLSEAPAHGKTIYEYAPGSNGSKDYRQLVNSVLS